MEPEKTASPVTIRDGPRALSLIERDQKAVQAHQIGLPCSRWPVSAMVSPRDAPWRAASVTNPDLSECASKSPLRAANWAAAQ